MKKRLAVSFVALALLGILPGSAMAKKKHLPPPPTCTLSVSPDVLARPGDSSTLSWTTTGASSFSLSPIGNVPTSGSLVVTPLFTTYYTGTAIGAGGTATCSASVEVRAWNLAGDWTLWFEKGSSVDEEEGGQIDNFPRTSITLPLNMQPGLLYEGGMHVYQGVLPGYSGSWAVMLFTPNVRPGHQKSVDVYVGIPDVSFGDVVPGIHVFSCKLFLERTSESYGWGVMTGEHREGQNTLIPGIAEVPDELFTSTCRAWKQTGGKG